MWCSLVGARSILRPLPCCAPERTKMLLFPLSASWQSRSTPLRSTSAASCSAALPTPCSSSKEMCFPGGTTLRNPVCSSAPDGTARELGRSNNRDDGAWEGDHLAAAPGSKRGWLCWLGCSSLVPLAFEYLKTSWDFPHVRKMIYSKGI